MLSLSGVTYSKLKIKMLHEIRKTIQDFKVNSVHDATTISAKTNSMTLTSSNFPINLTIYTVYFWKYMGENNLTVHNLSFFRELSKLHIIVDVEKYKRIKGSIIINSIRFSPSRVVITFLIFSYPISLVYIAILYTVISSSFTSTALTLLPIILQIFAMANSKSLPEATLFVHKIPSNHSMC